MPQDKYRQVNGPEGPINFPSSMSDDDVTQAMRKLYPPPKQAQPMEAQRPQQPAADMPSKFQVAVGKMVPQAAAPALAAANKYLVQPFDWLASKGVQAGRELGREMVTGWADPKEVEQLPGGKAALGVAGGVGAVAGGTVSDPRNWPFLASGAARPILQRAISGGFGVMMAGGTLEAAKDLHDNWDKYTPTQRWERGTEGTLSAIMTYGATHHALMGGDLAFDRGGDLKEKFGKEAKPTPNYPPTPETPMFTSPEAPKHTLSADELRSRIAAAQAATEPVKSKPIEKPVEPVKAAPIEASKPEAPKAQITNPAAEPARAAKTKQIIDDAYDKTGDKTPAALPKATRPIPDQVAGRIGQMRAQGLSEPEQVFTLMKEFPEHAENIAKAFGAKVGGPVETAPPTDAQGKPIQAPGATQGPGESVRPAERPALDYVERQKAREAELRASQPPAMKPELKETLGAKAEELSPRQKQLRLKQELEKQAGKPISQAPEALPRLSEEQKQLGAREPKPAGPPARDFSREMEIYKQRVQKYMDDHPGIPKQHAQMLVADQMRRERGSFGGGGEEDRQLRREKKINEWIGHLRDPNTPPQAIDNAFQMLKAFGLDDNEIIRRVSGAEGFAINPADEAIGSENNQWADFKIPREQRGQERTPEEDRQARYQERLADLKAKFRERFDREPNKQEQYGLETAAWKAELKTVDKIIADHIRAAKNYYLTENTDHATKALEAFEKLKNLGLSDEEILNRINQHPDWQFTDPHTKELIQSVLDQASLQFYKDLKTGKDASLSGINDLIDKSDEILARHNVEKRSLSEIYETSQALAGIERATGADADQKMQAFLQKPFGELPSDEIQRLRKEIDDEIIRQRRKKEGGFWILGGGKRPAQPRAGANALDEFTAKLEATMKTVAPDDGRMRFGEKLARSMSEGWDDLHIAAAKVAAQAVALKDMYLRPPQITDYIDAIGRFSGSLNRSTWELRKFSQEIKRVIPDKRRREAITNWVQAGGDPTVLELRALNSKDKYLRAGYDAARNLSPEEERVARYAMSLFDQRLQEAVNLGILREGLENYVPQMWKPKDQTAAGTFYSSLHRGGTLKVDFNAARKRIFESYFEGEQAGRVPVDKDIGFAVTSWERAFAKAKASRTLVGDLSNATAKDGRPLVSPSGTGKPIYDVSSPTPDDKARAYVIFPKATPEETGDYRLVDHPAMTKWQWMTKDDNGAPIMLKGDLRVHPEAFKKLDNVINRGRWNSDHPVLTGVLKAQGFFKATLLMASPFHQVQEGTHGVFHGVNSFHPPEIDMNNPAMGKLLDHGLVLGSFDPAAAFEEGLTSSGLLGKVPGFGQFMQKYTDYLFQDYIPRLKADMGVNAYERNIKVYEKDILAGKITTDQIAMITAAQANAAFGELNYMMMGRSPGMQAALRLMFLAPDFFEARARFVGQALKPYGREQQMALFVRGAGGMYVLGRVLNELADGNPHWDKPFSLVYHGNEYKMRSLPGDIWHLMEDPNSFMLHRLNPVTTKPAMEFATGRDDFGRKRSMGQQAMDFFRGVTPIFAQGAFKHTPETVFDSMLASAGITKTKYRTKAGAMAHQYAIGSNPDELTSHHVQEIVQDLTNGNLPPDKVGDLLRTGQMNPKDFFTAVKLAQLPELYRDYQRLPVEQKAKVLAAASPQERALIRAYSKRELDTTRLLPEQRAEFMRSYAKQ